MSELFDALLGALAAPVFLVVLALAACGTTLYQCSQHDYVNQPRGLGR